MTPLGAITDRVARPTPTASRRTTSSRTAIASTPAICPLRSRTGVASSTCASPVIGLTIGSPIIVTPSAIGFRNSGNRLRSSPPAGRGATEHEMAPRRSP
jgi:hypothetical protein